MAGARQKLPDNLINKWGGRYQPLQPVSAPAVAVVPSLPESTPLVEELWRLLWESPLAGAFKPTDVPALRRWAWWVGQWHRVAQQMEREDVLVEGAHGNQVLNPLTRYLKQCESSVRELEKAFGMDALSRLRLGLTLVEEQSVIAKLKQPVKPRAYDDTSGAT